VSLEATQFIMIIATDGFNVSIKALDLAFFFFFRAI
jgi:hypothetical protein